MSQPRALPFRIRPDLQVAAVEWSGEAVFVVKDPLALRYFHLPQAQYRALSTLDGRVSLQEWGERLSESGDTPEGGLARLRSWLQEFIHWGLVTRERWTSPTAPKPTARWLTLRWLASVIQNPLAIQFRGFDPERLLSRLSPVSRIAFSSAGLIIGLVVAAVVWLFTFSEFDSFLRRLPPWETLNLPSTWVSVWIAIGISKILHELAHGLMARKVGAECHTIGFSLIMLSPCLYCDVSDSWRLPRRRDRIAIALAGIWAETVLGASSLAAWWATSPSMLHDWFWHLTAVTCASSLLINLNPLAKYDGYYVLCDLWSIPNLREQADEALRQALRRPIHGPAHVRTARPPFARSLGLCGYALAAAGYRVFTVASIGWSVAYFLLPWGLETLTWLYAVPAAAGLSYHAAKFGASTVSKGTGWRRWFVSGLILLGLLGIGYGLLMSTIPWREGAPFVIEPRDAQPVYVTTAGRFARVLASYGETVQIGQPLAELTDADLERRRLQLLTECALREQDIELARLQDRPAVQEDAQAALNGLAEQLAEVDRKRERLRIIAPCTGRFLPPHPQTEPTDDPDQTTLPKWYGTPLDARNIGCQLEAGTALGNVAPNDDAHATRVTLYLEQRLRPELEVGSVIDLQPKGLPERRWIARVIEIGHGTTHELPPELNAAQPAASPAGQQAPGHFVIVAEPEADLPLPIGTTGWARFDCRPKTTGERLVEWVRRTIPALW